MRGVFWAFPLSLLAAGVAHVCVTGAPLIVGAGPGAIGLVRMVDGRLTFGEPVGPEWLRQIQARLTRQSLLTRQRFARSIGMRLGGDLVLEVRWQRKSLLEKSSGETGLHHPRG